MEQKEIRLVIDSDLKNVSLVGTAINALFPSMACSRYSANDIELCVVEAVNNCIEHAYEKKKGHEIEVLFTLHQDRLVIVICDTGKTMEIDRLAQSDLSTLETDNVQLDTLAEHGRGLAIIKEIMDVVTYETKKGKNCLSLTTFLDS